LVLNPALALLSLALFQPMFACVIPVAPDFQDPLAAANVPPYLHDWMPARGPVFSVFGSATSLPTTNFTVQITDPNVDDTIYYRWVLNYPPSSGTTTIAFSAPDAQDGPPATGAVHNFTANFPMNCAVVQGQSISSGLEQHFSLFVADREFVTSLKLDQVPRGTYLQEIDWTLIFQCGSGTQ
jgi:hypothetical protein